MPFNKDALHLSKMIFTFYFKISGNLFEADYQKMRENLMFDHNFFCMNWINVYYTLQHCCGHRIWTRDLDMFSVSILRTTEKTTNSIRCGSSEQTSGPNPLKLSLYRISKLVMTPKTYVHPTPTPFFLLYIPLNCHEQGKYFQYRKQGIKHIKVALYGL